MSSKSNRFPPDGIGSTVKISWSYLSKNYKKLKFRKPYTKNRWFYMVKLWEKYLEAKLIDSDNFDEF